MEIIYSDATISMSEFKKNPAAVLRDAKSRPVAVLNHNKAAFYMVEPALFEAILDELADQDLHRTVLARMGERANAIEVDVDATGDVRGSVQAATGTGARISTSAGIRIPSLKRRIMFSDSGRL